MSADKDFTLIFKAEVEERLVVMNQGVVDLEKCPDNKDLVRDMNREAHNIKGSARVFGYADIQDVAHKIEDIFDAVSQSKLVFDRTVAENIFKGLDAIRSILGTLGTLDKNGVDIKGVCLALDGCLSVRENAGPSPERKEPRRENEVPSEKQDLNPVPKGAEFIRVPVERVNKLLNLTGEMVINKMKSSQKISCVKGVFKLTKELQRELAGMNEKLKKYISDEDPELRTKMGQCLMKLEKLKKDSRSLNAHISEEALHLEPIIDELQDSVKEMRMLPCSFILQQFPRMVRDIAAGEGKEINLEISGEATELDKNVLEGLKDPIMHILRNCIDHGIEAPDKRLAAGKPAAGNIKIRAYHETGNVVITIEDDGMGIDPQIIKRNALKKRFISEKELDSMTEEAIINIVFMDGYSTSRIITDLSGRGIGLDVVRRNLTRLKGKVLLDTEKGKGTKFTLVLPLTIAVVKVLMLECEGLKLAIPMTEVFEAMEVDRKDIMTLEGRMAASVRGQSVPLINLSEVLRVKRVSSGGGDPEVKDRTGAEEVLQVIVVSSLGKMVGFIVDEIISEEEIFIKSLGGHLGKLVNISGATILGTGEVVIILDAADLISQSRMSHPAVSGRSVMPEEDHGEKSILVVDDMFSTRELEKSILESCGYSVDTAVDGKDGMEKVSSNRYDLIVTDIEMPGMNGFELCEALKSNDDYKNIPLIMVTALEKEEDKRRGIDVGAQAYIVKTDFEQSTLLDTVERLLG